MKYDQEIYNSAIALVGISLRIPTISTHKEFFNALVFGKEFINDYSTDRLVESGINPDQLNNNLYVKRGSNFEEKAKFDADFFGISTADAIRMDPQHRILLECTYNALEDAGYPPFQTEEAIGIFGGCDTDTYLLNHILSKGNLLAQFNQADLIRYSSPLTTQIAYHLGLNGPAVDVNTACSTSLVALHMACRSLLMYECNMCIACAASISGTKKLGYSYIKDGILSKDGYCRPFDVNATGTVPGQGVVVVVLKRLQDAIKNKDNIYAIIRGSAINNDGRDKMSYTAPSVDGQNKVIRQALAVAEVLPEQVNFVECHGTGTLLGDPIEVAALSSVYGQEDRVKPLYIGSVKSNLGHLNSAAGLISFVKAALSIKNKQLPPSIHFSTINPNIDLSGTNIEVASESRQLLEKNIFAGVSSFGIGGTNTHVILENFDEFSNQENDKSNQPYQLTLSAKNHSSLMLEFSEICQFVKNNSEIDVNTFVETLNRGRDKFDFITTLKFSSLDELLEISLENLIIEERNTEFEKNKSFDFCKMSLPGYNFKHNDYWFDDNKVESKISDNNQDCFSDLEKKVMKIWEKHLGCKPIKIEDDFYDLGGHSLMALEIIAEVNVEFKVDLGLEDLLDCSTVLSFIKHLNLRIEELETSVSD